MNITSAESVSKGSGNHEAYVHIVNEQTTYQSKDAFSFSWIWFSKSVNIQYWIENMMVSQSYIYPSQTGVGVSHIMT